MKYGVVLTCLWLANTARGAENLFCRYWQLQSSNQTRYAAACINNYAPYPGTVPNPACNHFKRQGYPNILMTQHASYCPPKHKPYIRKRK
ncbi:hypothetical protein Noda2021_05360 [Candidatus Dependentiae bacterium Noda2021]|nr:hypothetical protein Noda2021_05360 [Candidatus Dependentiae bacterium Noda2021]